MIFIRLQHCKIYIYITYEQAHLLSLPTALKEGPTNWFSASLISLRLKCPILPCYVLIWMVAQISSHVKFSSFKTEKNLEF